MSINAVQNRSTTNGWSELDARVNDGLDVSLHWHATSARVKVVVVDLRAGTTVEFDVGHSEALTAFRHPYRYAPSEEATADRAVGASAHPNFTTSAGAHNVSE
jgi:hypothetical protein